LHINDPVVLAEVTHAFNAYERALMANDIEALDDLFWNSPLTLRYGAGENLYGHDDIAAYRRTRGGAAQRTLTRVSITSFGRDFATANAEFLQNGSTRIGRQSHVWVRTEAGWKISAAHVSMMSL
jgi:hypothetical protein